MITSKRINHLLGHVNLYLAFLSVLYFCAKVQCSVSKISFSINPNCDLGDKECQKPWLVYGKKENESCAIHYLWSAEKIPSLLMAYSVPEADISINWTDFASGIPGSITFSQVPENVLGIQFQTLILFNDVHDEGTLDNIPEKEKKYAPLSDFDWKLDSCKNITSQECRFSFYTTHFRGKLLDNDTKVSISVTSFEEEGRSDELPHLVKTPFSVQVEVLLDNLILDLNGTTNNDHHAKDEVVPISGFYHPRYAVDFIIISDDKPDVDDETKFDYVNVKSLDDEYTPGVFDLNSIRTEGARKSSAGPNEGGYFQWRPVCYLNSDKDINYSTYPNINSSLPAIDQQHQERAENSLFYAIFGNQMTNLVGMQSPVAFGLSKDKYYTEHNYTEWTFTMGLGSVPTEGFSNLIIIIISVAVGLPCALFVSGGAYLLIKKIRRSRVEERVYE